MEQLQQEPESGMSLGHNFYKIRLAVQSKKRGRSGSLRVISHVDIIVRDEAADIYLLYLYDKSEIASIDIRIIKREMEKYRDLK